MLISAVSVSAIMATLVMSTIALASSMIMFEQSVYAVDNCDATSTCTNFQSQPGNRQTNNCKNSSNCGNIANGNDNTQTNRCDSVPQRCSNFLIGEGNSQSNNCNSVAGFGCFTFADGNDNTLTNRCGSAACNSVASGDGNTVKTECHSVETFCQNGARGSDNTSYLFCARMHNCDVVNGLPQTPVSSTTRSTICGNADSCTNVDINSNVLANGASCKSNGPDTTTVCHPGNTRIIPNP